MSRDIIQIEGDMPDMPEVPWPPLEVEFPEESKGKPWERDPAPNATEPERRETAQRHRGEMIPGSGVEIISDPRQMREMAMQSALVRAKTALTAWDQAMDWAEIDDPTLPGDYEAVAKGMVDFIEREKARIERR